MVGIGEQMVKAERGRNEQRGFRKNSVCFIMNLGVEKVIKLTFTFNFLGQTVKSL